MLDARIGQLCRNGSPVFYATIKGRHVEGTRREIERKLGVRPAPDQLQAYRKAAMLRLSCKPGKPYDVRQHRRAVRIACKWQRAFLGDDSLGASHRAIVRASWHFSHREFARITRRAAATV